MMDAETMAVEESQGATQGTIDAEKAPESRSGADLQPDDHRNLELEEAVGEQSSDREGAHDGGDEAGFAEANLDPRMGSGPQNTPESDPPINTIQPVAARVRKLSSPPFGEDVPTTSGFAQSASHPLYGQPQDFEPDWTLGFDSIGSTNASIRMYDQDNVVPNLDLYGGLQNLQTQVDFNRLVPLDRNLPGASFIPYSSPIAYPRSPIFGAGRGASPGHNTRHLIPSSSGSTSPRVGGNVTTRFASHPSLHSSGLSRHSLSYDDSSPHDNLARGSDRFNDSVGPHIMEPSPRRFSQHVAGQERALLFQDFTSHPSSFDAATHSPASGPARLSPLTQTMGNMPVGRSRANTDIVPGGEDEVIGIRRASRHRDSAAEEQEAEPIQPMRFRSIKAAEDAARSHISRHFIPVFDETYPETEQDEYRYAVLLFNAMMDSDDAEDNMKMKTQWIRTTEQTPEAVEAAAWRALKRTMDYYKQPGFLRNRHPYPATLKKFEVFSEHISCVCEALRLNKTICRHFLGSSYMDGTIDDPRSAVSRVKNNRKVNAEKKLKKERLEQEKVAALMELEAVQQTPRPDLALEEPDDEVISIRPRKRSRQEGL